MKKYKIYLLIISGLLLSACDETSSKPKTKPIVPLVGVLEDGKIYYQSQCGVCHSAGEDRSTAFGALDLSQLQVDRIQSDMSDLGGVIVSGTLIPLMGRIKNVPPQRVADLKAYFSTL